MAYVDGFILPLQKNKLKEYKKMAASVDKIWMKHGALEIKECIIEDAKTIEGSMPFPQVIGAKKNESVVFSYVVFKSRKHRDEVNARVMADPRFKKHCGHMPFDCKRMAYGGFEVIINLKK